MRLGRTLEHDPLSRNYPFVGRKVVKPKNRNWACNAPILDQGDVGSCEGNTAVEWLNSVVNLTQRKQYNHAAGKKGLLSTRFLVESNAVDLYSRATGLDNDDIPGKYLPDDTGTSAVGIAKAMQQVGAIGSYTWTFGWDHFLSAIDMGPVMLGTNWYDGMFDPDSRGYVQPAATDQDPVGGHAYLGRRIDYSLGRVLCRNHWTAEWGIKGEFWLTFATLKRLLAEQGDVLVPR